jgi:hypothetical protein
MSVDNPRIERLLNAQKAAGNYAPTNWNDFYKFLIARKQPGHKDPLLPLILGAYGESPESKLRRVADQLQWARENDCLDDALRYVENVPWISCPLKEWYQETYLWPDDE